MGFNAVTPDGTHVYVANDGSGSRWSTGPATQWWPRSRWGLAPWGWPLWAMIPLTFSPPRSRAALSEVL